MSFIKTIRDNKVAYFNSEYITVILKEQNGYVAKCDNFMGQIEDDDAKRLIDKIPQVKRIHK